MIGEQSNADVVPTTLCPQPHKSKSWLKSLCVLVSYWPLAARSLAARSSRVLDGFTPVEAPGVRARGASHNKRLSRS